MTRSAIAAGLAVARLALGPSLAAAQGPVGWEGLSGQFGARVLRDYRKNLTFPMGAYTLGTREWTSLSARGVIADDRLVNFSLRLRPEWEELRGTSFVEGGGVTLTTLGWSGSATILRNGRPYWITLDGGRSRVGQRDRFGFETERRVSNLVGQFYLSLKALPTRLRVQRSTQADEFGAAPALSWVTRSAELLAANSKTSVSLERRWFSSGTEPTLSDWLGSVGHQASWGKGSTWGSSLRYIRREDGSRRTDMGWTERGVIRHSERVSTNLNFQYARLTTQASAQGYWRAGLGVSYPILAGLRGGTQVDSRWTRRAITHEHVFTAGQSLGFAYALAGVVRLTGDGSMAFVRARQGAGEDGWVDVIGERHVVAADGTFLLDNPSVDLGSLRVESAARAIRYQGGLDYETVQSGSFAQVVILPGSRIAIGDTVAVDYRYRLAVFGARDQLAAVGRAGAKAGPVEAFFRMQRTEQLGRQPGGVAGGFYLFDLDETEYGLQLGGRTRFGQAHLEVSRLWRESPGLVFTSTRVNSSLTTRMAPGLSGGVSGAASWSGKPGDLARTLSLSGVLAWGPTRWVSVRALGGAWRLGGAGLDQTQVSGSVAGTLQVARVNLEIAYQGRVWETPQRVVEDRLTVSLARSF